MRSRGEAGAFGLLGVALLVTSWTPWFRYDVLGESIVRGHYVDPHSVDAWHGSSLWSWALALAIGAAIAGAIAAVAADGLARLLRIVGVAAGLCSAGLWWRQRWLIEHPRPSQGRKYYVYISSTDPRLLALPDDRYFIRRDELASYMTDNGHGFHAGATMAAGVGLFLICAVIVGLAVSHGRSSGRPSSA